MCFIVSFKHVAVTFLVAARLLAPVPNPDKRGELHQEGNLV